MKKHKLKLLFLGLLLPLFLLAGCNGTPSIKGKWNVQGAYGDINTTEFTDKKVVVEDKEKEYKQVATGFKNNSHYVVIEIQKQKYSIVFPDADKNIAILLQPSSDDDYLNGEMILAMNRKEVPNYEKYAEKYMNR